MSGGIKLLLARYLVLLLMMMAALVSDDAREENVSERFQSGRVSSHPERRAPHDSYCSCCIFSLLGCYGG